LSVSNQLALLFGKKKSLKEQKINK